VSILEELERAAVERGGQVSQRSHRPRQRRCAEHPQARAAALAPLRSMELRDSASGTGLLHFTGDASVYERGYEMWDMWGPYTEIVSAGAAEDLTRSDLDVPLVLAHDSLRRIARTTTGTLALSQDDEALRVDAPELDPEDADVRYIAPKLRSGLVDEMSFKFEITSGQWSPDYMEYRINSFRLHRGDVAIVGYGANPATSGALRSQLTPTVPGLSRMRTLLDLELARR
jgi:hypothetical protein